MGILNDLIQWLSKLFQWWVIVMPWEAGLRIRFGRKIKLLNEGVFVKFPIIDAVFIQTTRLRVMGCPIQTVSTKDGKTLSISVSVGYCIEDIRLLYQTLYHPEMTITNLVLGNISEYVAHNKIEDCTPDKIKESVTEILKDNPYGLGQLSVNILGYAVVKTYRLIQDQHYLQEGIRLDIKS